MQKTHIKHLCVNFLFQLSGGDTLTDRPCRVDREQLTDNSIYLEVVRV